MGLLDSLSALSKTADAKNEGKNLQKHLQMLNIVKMYSEMTTND